MKDTIYVAGTFNLLAKTAVKCATMIINEEFWPGIGKCRDNINPLLRKLLHGSGKSSSREQQKVNQRTSDH